MHRNQMVRSPPTNKTTTPNRLKFESDYDFEKANEQFKETLECLGIKVDRIKLQGILINL